MSKRMGFSVVGLPHYTIWHLYEPSVDDLRHMDEMEQERKALEQQEKEESERREREKEIFLDPTNGHEEDKTALRDILHRNHEAPAPSQPAEGKEDVSNKLE